MVVLVGGPGVFGQRALEVEALAGRQFVDMGGHGAVGVLLDEEIHVAFGVYGEELDNKYRKCLQRIGYSTFVADGRVRPHHRLLHPRSLVLSQNSAGNN